MATDAGAMCAQVLVAAPLLLMSMFQPRRIDSLAERLGPAAVERLRRYWEVQAWLVVEAGQAILDEASGNSVIDRDSVATAFAELAAIEAALGRSAMAALRPLLPFSRNDQWEGRELGERALLRRSRNG